jgi:predicted dehydrogenase
MFRVGILGSENSHAEAFIKIFNEAGSNGEKIYPDIKVVSVAGNYGEENLRLFTKYKLDFIAEKPSEMLGKVDAVMVTARDGKYHYGFAEPFLNAGIPAFIDKPFTSDGEEALALAKLAKKKNVPVCGGTFIKLVDDVISLKKARESGLGKISGGAVAAPLNMINPFGGFYFYSSHLAEMSLTIFGYNPQSLLAWEKEGNVTVSVDYPDYIVTNHFMNECYNSYFGAVFGKEGNMSKNIDISQGYFCECRDFAEMLRTGKSHISLRELILPVYYLNAIEKSYKTGIRQLVNVPEI